MKNVLIPIVKIILVPSELVGATSATDAAFQKKIYGSGMVTLIISNQEVKDIIKIVKPLEESGLLIKDVSETIENEAKEQKGQFLDMLVGTLVTNLLGNVIEGII